MSKSRRDLQRQRERLRGQLRARLAAQREAVRAKLRPGRRRSDDKRDRRWWAWLLGLLLLLLLLWRGCRCDPEIPPPAEDPAPAVGTGFVGPPAPPVEPPPPPMPRRDRPEYAAEPPAPLPWLAAFRIQVAARSARLGACFVGSDRPGRMRWTAAVEPGTGRVSDHTLEPTAGGGDLGTAERTCVIGVLSDPPYRLQDGGERSTPSRVGLVIEF